MTAVDFKNFKRQLSSLTPKQKQEIQRALENERYRLDAIESRRQLDAGKTITFTMAELDAYNKKLLGEQ